MPSIASRVTDAAARLVLKSATVGAIVDHGAFRTIELTGPDLAGPIWHPGDKVRLRVEGLTLRTYTPTRWDGQAGTTELLTYVPGDGPGSRSCAAASRGQPVQLLAPGRSVRLDRFDAAPILVGDETSFGLAQAWHQYRPDRPAPVHLFEVSSSADCAGVLNQLGLAHVALVTRTDGESSDLADRAVEAVRDHPGAPLCLTGRAQTIAAIRRRLKAEGLAPPSTLVKAYWDVNRAGLD